ncbi:MAG: radical SAM protein [Methanoregula sp.]|nr:radical SAM protein [Methanoregula sp.]
MPDYFTITKSDTIPRLPLEGSIDLTYRCNNNCRHCWTRIPPGAREKQDELSFEEICHIVDEARQMGCRRWSISGGEPLARPDFPEIFDYITRKSISYSLNTNGTLITSDIAQLMTRKGSKMISLYGASEAVHDYITRNPGSFGATMRGCTLLQDAGAGFTVQIIPMKDNYHEFPAMVELAKSLSPHWKIGASWLYLSACGSPGKNSEIARQRLSPSDIIAIENPYIPGPKQDIPRETCPTEQMDERLFARCIQTRRDFHIDPCGMMSFCGFIKDPSMRYNLRTGSFEEAWNEFIPSLQEKILGGREYRDNCGACNRRSDCRWCPVYAYLETGRYSAKIPYLCEITDEVKKFRDTWQKKHRRFFQVAGITVCIEADLDLDTIRITDALASFAVDGPGTDNVLIRYHFEIPDLASADLGTEIYRRPPWVISQRKGTWIYRRIFPTLADPEPGLAWVFHNDYSRATIYLSPEYKEQVNGYTWDTLAYLTTDQIWLAPLLADRNAVMIHSAAAIVNGQGLMFVGRSGAGKSTTVTLLKKAGMSREPGSTITTEILCDDRNIVRHQNNGWYVYGTWHHGDVPDVSAASAPLRAVLFLQQDTINRLTRIDDRRDILKRLLSMLIRPLATEAWWQKELDVLEKIVAEVPCYIMQFDTSGAIVKDLENLVQGIPDPES